MKSIPIMVALVGGATVAAPANFAESYAALREKTVAARRAVFADIHQKWANVSVSTSSVVARSPGISTTNATNVVATAQAAIQTSVDGTDAGFTLAPLLLAGITSDHQVTLSFGALKDGQAQIGAAWTYQGAGGIGTRALTFEALGLQQCDLSESKLGNEIDLRMQSFRKACEAIALLTREPGALLKDQKKEALVREKKRWSYAHLYCEDPDQAPDYYIATRVITSALTDARDRSDANAADRPPTEFIQKMGSLEVRDAVKHLDDFNFDAAAGCLDDKTITEALVQYNWLTARHKFGVSAQLRAFPWRFGFNSAADPSKAPLSAGEVSSLKARGEYTLDHRGLEVVAGLGIGAERSVSTDSLRPVLSPSFSVASVVAWIGPDPVSVSNGVPSVSLTGGVLPPRLIAGFDLSLDWALSYPDTQVRSLRAFDATAFLEARFTDSFAIRAGVPLHAELKTRAADTSTSPPVTERRDLQWSVPVFIYTALKVP